ncbi:hypothetical protein [Microbacterium sp. SSM24]|uniref:hypothetical protein n=1 Tax=Microbacterium sp. SSM24 TaxID=2991714 RepID=UPI002226F4F9|nr:hypothetical protein [Microbacterium sp. SSM24]MCW3493604.1 hypothetical protein [Microbacterium sp. SSM24]
MLGDALVLNLAVFGISLVVVLAALIFAISWDRSRRKQTPAPGVADRPADPPPARE